MDKSIFNPRDQESNISNKIIVGLERISEVFKVLLWEKAKLVGLSPIQIQILFSLHITNKNCVMLVISLKNLTSPKQL